MPQVYHDSVPKRLTIEESLHESLAPHFQPIYLQSLTPEKVQEIFSESADRVFIDFVRVAIRKGSLK